MKNVYLLFILLMLNLTTFAQTSVEERDGKLYANKVLYSVKKNDVAEFKKLVINIADWEKLLAAHTKVPKAEKQEMLAKGKADIALASPEKIFEKIQKAVKREFIDWNQVKITSIATAFEKKGHLHYMSFTIYFEIEQKSYMLSAKECIKTPNGWKMSKGADLTLISK
jgi:hypothetical protein